VVFATIRRRSSLVTFFKLRLDLRTNSFMADGEGLSGHTLPCVRAKCASLLWRTEPGHRKAQQIGKLCAGVGLSALLPPHPAAATCSRSVDCTSRPALREAGSNFAQSHSAARFG